MSPEMSINNRPATPPPPYQKYETDVLPPPPTAQTRTSYATQHVHSSSVERGASPVGQDRVVSTRGQSFKKSMWRVVGVLFLFAIAIVVIAVVYSNRTKKSEPNRPYDDDDDDYYYYPTPTTYYPDFPSSTTGPTEPTQTLQMEGLAHGFAVSALSSGEARVWQLDGPGRLLYWDEGEGLYWNGEFSWRFSTGPIIAPTGDQSQIAVGLSDLTGHHLVMHYRPDQGWDRDFYELEMPGCCNGIDNGPSETDLDCCNKFPHRPAVVSRAEGRVDIINIDRHNTIQIVSYDGEQWSEWKALGSANKHVTATSWGEDRIDVFVKNDQDILHKFWTAEDDWSPTWEIIGSFDKDDSHYGDSDYWTPQAVSWTTEDGDGVIDVIVSRNVTSHKTFSNGEWGEWNEIPLNHGGREYPDTQSVVSGDGRDGRPFAHLISRGTDNCLHYTTHDGTGWDEFVNLWCMPDPYDRYTLYFETSAADAGDGTIKVVSRDTDDGDLMLYKTEGAGSGDKAGEDVWQKLPNIFD